MLRLCGFLLPMFSKVSCMPTAGVSRCACTFVMAYMAEHIQYPSDCLCQSLCSTSRVQTHVHPTSKICNMTSHCVLLVSLYVFSVHQEIRQHAATDGPCSTWRTLDPRIYCVSQGQDRQVFGLRHAELPANFANKYACEAKSP